MPDLGRYAVEIGLAYAGSLVLLGGLVAWVWLRGRAARRRLAEVEARRAATERGER
jgi:heme exporter protein D